MIVDLTQERDYLSSQQTLEVCRNLSMSSPERLLGSSDACLSNGCGTTLSSSGLSKEERQHLSVELADTKAKLRRYRQELYVFVSPFLATHPVNGVFSSCNPVKYKVSTGALCIADYQNTTRIIFSVSVLAVKEGDISTGQPITEGPLVLRLHPLQPLEKQQCLLFCQLVPNLHYNYMVYYTHTLTHSHVHAHAHAHTPTVSRLVTQTLLQLCTATVCWSSSAAS